MSVWKFKRARDSLEKHLGTAYKNLNSSNYFQISELFPNPFFKVMFHVLSSSNYPFLSLPKTNQLSNAKEIITTLKVMFIFFIVFN